MLSENQVLAEEEMAINLSNVRLIDGTRNVWDGYPLSIGTELAVNNRQRNERIAKAV